MTRAMKMWIGNLDGSRQGLVIVPSREQARKIIGTSRGDFDDYWVLQPGVDPDFAPGVLYTRVMWASHAAWQRGRCRLGG